MKKAFTPELRFTTNRYCIHAILVVLLCLGYTGSQAQLSSNYVFSYSGPVYTPLDTSSTKLVSGATDVNKDSTWANINLGFNFKFNCTTYTQVGISSNGFVWFGSTAPAANEYTPISSPVGYSGIIAGFASNLVAGTSTVFMGSNTTTAIKYKVSGTAPARVFTAEWIKVASGNVNNAFDMQIKLYEGSNKIDIILWDYHYALSGSTSYGQVGLRGASNADFTNRKIAGINSSNWCHSQEGTTNTDKCAIAPFPGNCVYASSSTSTAVKFTYSSIVCDGGWNIKGRVYHDANSNCDRDSSEAYLNNIKVQLYNSTGTLVDQIYTYGGGYYFFDTEYDIYTVKIDTGSTAYAVLCPGSGDYTVDINATDSTSSGLDFGMTCKQGIMDVGVKALARYSGRFFPAATATMRLNAGDLAAGSSCINGTTKGKVIVVITGPAKYIGVPSGAYPPTSFSTDSVIWDIANFSLLDINAYFKFNVRTDTTALLGQQVCFTAYAYADTGTDLNLANNIYTRCYPITNSYDPNLKEVDYEVVQQAGRWLTYDTHFQNLGNAEAENIYVLDSLDSGLDISTFELLLASHDNITTISKDGIVKFEFPNIMLPDSAHNPTGSQGHIQYRIRMKDDVTPGSIVYSTSAVYFDFNPPVITNTATTVYAVATGEKGIAQNMEMRVYPNPANNYAVVNYGGELKNASMIAYDVAGRIVVNQAAHTGDNILSLETLSNGYYYLHLLNGSNTVAAKKLVVIK